MAEFAWYISQHDIVADLMGHPVILCYGVLSGYVYALAADKRGISCFVCDRLTIRVFKNLFALTRPRALEILEIVAGPLLQK